jgi:ABC-type branched-subunit amino acid transport system ATPase component
MILQVARLSAWYGEARALWDVAVRVARGEVVGILGRNGAGKTTLLRSIAGLQSRIEGDIALNGQRLTGLRTDDIALRGLAMSRESGKLPASLTVLQNLALGQRLARKKGKGSRTLADVWKWFPLLEPLQERKAGLLSGGQRQGLSLAVAFISEPEVMLLDEPSAGLSPPVAHALFKTIRQFADAGTSVMMVEQHPAWLIGVADRGYLLEVGRVTGEGDIEAIVKNARVADMA